ncbi:MAG: hypothetical protein WDW38_010394 [Sanguina aurantia]
MGTKADSETKTICRKLAVFLPLFYMLYYLVSIILIGALKVGWQELGRYPFRISSGEFSPTHSYPALGAWLAMVITYTLSIGLSFCVVKATRKSWDYIATASLLHLILCIAINQAFPVNWVWWVTLLVSIGVLSLASELVTYYLIDLREIKLDNL